MARVPTEAPIPLSPRWLSPPPADRPDSGWGVPGAWLRGLPDLEHIRVPLGGIGLRIGGLALRFDESLRLDLTARPVLGTRLAISVGKKRYEVPLPALQIVPRLANGALFLEVGLVLFERRF